MELYDLAETILIWGSVISCIGLMIYLAYRQIREMKLRRWRRRHRGRTRRHGNTIS